MVVLRPITADDILEIKGWPSYPPEFSLLDYCHKDGGWLDTYGRDERNAVFVAVDNGGIAGFSLLLEEKSASPEFMVALAPARLGGGLGKAVARLTLERGFLRPGTLAIRLIVRKNNFRAQALYETLGFARTGEMTKEVQGVPVDFFCMEISREEFYGKKGETMKQALLVIDVQNEYFTGVLPVTYPAGSLANITKAMDHAHAAGIPVAVIQHTSPAPDAPAFRKGSHGWELHDEIKKRHVDVVIEKALPGSFTGTNLGAWLNKNGIGAVTVAGYMTQMCCDTTARQAVHLGYAVNFLSDATGTLAVSNAAGSVTAEELHRAILVTQQMRFARVMKTEEWVKGIKKLT